MFVCVLLWHLSYDFVLSSSKVFLELEKAEFFDAAVNVGMLIFFKKMEDTTNLTVETQQTFRD